LKSKNLHTDSKHRILRKTLYGFGLIIFFGTNLSLHAQEPVLVRQISKKPVIAISVDAYDRVITADAQGNVTAYDTLGKALYQYSPRTVADVTLLEAWRSMQILVFYRDLQQYALLDRFLTPLSGYPYPARLPSERVGFARLMTPAYDDQFWIFDDTDFSLKKYNPSLQTLALHSPLNLVLDPQDYQLTFMREYQNQLFIADRNSGILVFDNLGNYRRKLPFRDLTYFQFIENELYFLEKDTLRFYNIYTHAERTVPLPVPAKTAVIVGRWLFVFSDRGGFLYRLG